MWFTDLQKAITALEQRGMSHYFFSKIAPAGDGGIVFETTHFTFVKWFPNGEVIEHRKDEWRKRG